MYLCVLSVLLYVCESIPPCESGYLQAPRGFPIRSSRSSCSPPPLLLLSLLLSFTFFCFPPHALLILRVFTLSAWITAAFPLISARCLFHPLPPSALVLECRGGNAPARHTRAIRWERSSCTRRPERCENAPRRTRFQTLVLGGRTCT